MHMRSHPAEYPQSDPEYKEWVAEKWDVSKEEVPLAPAPWRKQKHLFEEWVEEASLLRSST